MNRNEIFNLPEIHISSPDLPKAFHGFTAVQLTDFHFGRATPESHLAHAFRLARAFDPDVVLLTGDLIQVNRLGIDDLLRALVGPTLSGWKKTRRRALGYLSRFDELLGELQPPHGIFGVFGNHDYREEVHRAQFRTPIRWLRNESAHIERDGGLLQIAGVDDLWLGKVDIRAALASDSSPFCRLLLTHNPDLVLHPDAHLLDTVHLMLAGHTHGGQIRLPVVGPITTRTAQRDHVHGLSWRNQTAIYTSAGIGYGCVGLRIGCPPEVVALRFARSG